MRKFKNLGITLLNFKIKYELCKWHVKNMSYVNNMTYVNNI